MKTLSLFIFLSLLALSLDAQGYIYNPTTGGNGGIPYTEVMPNYSSITSIHIYHGQYVDGFTMNFVDENGHRGSIHVGQKSGHKSIYDLDRDAKLSGFDVYYGRVLDRIRFRFTDGTATPFYGGDGGAFNSHNMAPGALAVGFHGRYGRVIDSIGLVYRYPNTSRSGR